MKVMGEMSSAGDKLEREKGQDCKNNKDLHLMNQCDTFRHSPNAGITKYKSLAPV